MPLNSLISYLNSLVAVLQLGDVREFISSFSLFLRVTAIGRLSLFFVSSGLATLFRRLSGLLSISVGGLGLLRLHFGLGRFLWISRLCGSGLGGIRRLLLPLDTRDLMLKLLISYLFECLNISVHADDDCQDEHRDHRE